MNLRDIRQLARTLALLSQLGLTVAVAILLGVGLGVGLQGILGVFGPLLGIVLGIGGAVIGASRLVAEVIPAARPPERIGSPEDRAEE